LSHNQGYFGPKKRRNVGLEFRSNQRAAITLGQFDPYNTRTLSKMHVRYVFQKIEYNILHNTRTFRSPVEAQCYLLIMLL